MADRRSFLRGLVSLPLIGGGVTLIGAPSAPVPLVQAAALPAGTLAMQVPAFDPVAFLDDLEAAGYAACACQRYTSGGIPSGPPALMIVPSAAKGFGGPRYRAVMARWSDAMDTCPDWPDRGLAILRA